MKPLLYIILMIINSQAIIENANIETVAQRVVDNFRPKNKTNTRFTGVCPLCNDDNKRLDINPKKNNWFCGHCKKGGGVFQLYQYCSKLDSSKDYVLIIEGIADITTQTVEYSKDTQVKSNKKSSSETFTQKQLKESGLTLDDVTVRLKPSENNTETTVLRFRSGTTDDGDNEIPGDDMLITYLTLDREVATYQKTTRTGQAIGQAKKFTRVRYAVPELHLDSNEKPIKYKSPKKSGAFIYLPNAIITAYENKTPIDTLFIQEGEKKAEKACKHGILSVGIQGIHMLSDGEQLHPDLARIVRQCNVKNVVFVLDANMFELPIEVDKNIERKANDAYRATQKFRYYFKALENTGLEVTTYFSYINPSCGQKGIDDLLVSMDKPDELLNDFISAKKNQPTGIGTKVVVIDITESSQQALKKLFNLHTREAFVTQFYPELKDREYFLFAGTKYKIVNDEIQLAQPISDEERFWDYDYIGRKKNYVFKYENYYTYLHNSHIGRYLPDDNIEYDYELIELTPTTRTVRKINYQYIVDFTVDTVRKMGEPQLLNWLHGSEKLLSPRTVQNCLKIDFSFVPKVPGAENLFFTNGFWHITANTITQHPLHEANGYVWQHKLKPFTPSLLPEPLVKIEQDSDGQYKAIFSDAAKDCEFLQYLIDSGDFYFEERGGREQPITNPVHYAETITHLANKLSCLGYLCHSYFSPSKAKSIVAMDGVSREAGQTQGRTGKSSIIGESINVLKSVAYIDAKKPKINDDKYIFSVVTDETEVVWLDDLKQNFDLEVLFNATLGHLAVRQMHKADRYINKENTPKFYIPTNYGINLQKGDSVTDRFFFMVFSPYYNKDYKPTTKFKHEFYKDWDDEQYNLFFNLYACALQVYFQHGLITAPGNRPEAIAYREQVGESFIEWATSYFTTDNLNTELVKKDVFEDYLKNNVFNKNHTPSPRKLKEKLRAWAEMNDMVINPNVPRVSAGKTVSPDGGDIKKSGVEYIILVPKKEIDASLQTTVTPTPPHNDIPTTNSLTIAAPDADDDEPF